MTETDARMRVGRILLGGVLAFLASFVLMFGIVSGYALKLGFEARGAPDQARIQAFAESIGPIWGPTSLALMTLIAAFWAMRKVGARHALQGTLVGLVAALPGLVLAFPPSTSDFVALAAALGAGWLGGTLAGRRSPVPPSSGAQT